MAKEPKQPRKNAAQLKNEEIIGAATRVSTLWLDFRKVVRRAFSNQPSAMDEEQKFLDLKSNLARYQRILAQRLPEGFRYGGKGMTDLMGQAISIGGLREMPAQDKKGVYERWHRAHISLQHLIGILDLLQEGFPVKFESAKGKTGNIKADIGGGGKKKKAMDKKKLVIGVLLAAGAAYAAWIYMGK